MNWFDAATGLALVVGGVYLLTQLGPLGVGLHNYYVNVQAATKRAYTGWWRWLAWSYTPTVKQSRFLAGLLASWAVFQGAYWAVDAVFGYEVPVLQWLLIELDSHPRPSTK